MEEIRRMIRNHSNGLALGPGIHSIQNAAWEPPRHSAERYQPTSIR